MSDAKELALQLTRTLEAVEAMVSLLMESKLQEDQLAYSDSIQQSIGRVKSMWQEFNHIVLPQDVRAPSDSSSQGFHVLVAEADAVQRMFAVRTLEKSGYKVSVSGNGQETISIYQEKSIDLILLDSELKILDGFETAIAIRKLEKKTGRHVPIIAYTSHSMAGFRERCMQVGMDDYIKKPVSSEGLVSHVNHHRDVNSKKSKVK